MRTRGVAAVLAAALLLSGCTASPAATVSVDTSGSPNADAVALPRDLDAMIEDAIARLPALAEAELAKSGVPGMTIAVVHGDETVWTGAFGVKVAGGDEPVDPETVFQIASISKAITGTAIAKAVSEGALEWDTPVHELLPDFALADPYVTEHATIADYMSHVSGLATGDGDDLEMLGHDRATILDRLRLLPLAPFRSTYQYSNFGITVAGEATAAALGTTWEDALQELLLDPLGMTSTSPRHADFLARDDRATINALEGGVFAPLRERNADAEAPAGGISSNVIDLAAWMKLLIADGRLAGDSDAEPFISGDALVPAVTGQVKVAQVGDPADRTGMYGYGFNVDVQADGRTSIGHSGAFLSGTGTSFRIVPSLDLGIVVLTNGSPVGLAEGLVSEFFDLVTLGELSRDWVDVYGSVMAHYYEPEGDLVGEVRPPDAAAPAPLAEYAGTYSSPYFGDLVVTADPDGLVGRLGTSGWALEPWEGDVFAFDLVGEEAPVGSISSATFRRGPDGAVDAVTLAFFDGNGLGTFTRD